MASALQHINTDADVQGYYFVNRDGSVGYIKTSSNWFGSSSARYNLQSGARVYYQATGKNLFSRYTITSR